MTRDRLPLGGSLTLSRCSSSVIIKVLDLAGKRRMTLTDMTKQRGISLALRHFVLNWESYRGVVADELGIGTTELIALGHLYEFGSQTPTELGHRTGLSSGSVTALLDRLEKAGYITRQQNPEDRRSLIVGANPAGRHAVQWAYDQFDVAVGSVLAQSPEIDPDRVREFFETFAETLTELGTRQRT